MSWQDWARQQGGFVVRNQLRVDGVTPRMIDRMFVRGPLVRTSARGVYRVAGAPHTSDSDAWLAVLRTSSPLSFLSAAVWWQMEPLPVDDRIHITRHDRRRLDWPLGVRVHRVALDAAHVVEHKGLPVTGRVETALDCLGWMAPRAARRFGDRAMQQGWLSPDDVERRLRQQPGRWGNRQLRALLADLTDGAAAESERRLHGLLRSAGMRDWRPNFAVCVGDRRYLLDVAFPDRRLAIEIDGYQFHSSVRAFERDRLRQNALVAAGWTVLRFTWWDITERPDTVLATITSLLAA